MLLKAKMNLMGRKGKAGSDEGLIQSNPTFPQNQKGPQAVKGHQIMV